MTIKRQSERSFKKSMVLEKFRKMAQDAEVKSEFRVQKEFTILILDDSLVSARELAEKIQSVKQCRVFPCQSEFSALKLLKQEKIDMIVMDLELPNFDSFAFAKSVRTLIRPDLPIIFFSADPDREADYYFRREENTGFIKNPLDQNLFQEEFLANILELEVV